MSELLFFDTETSGKYHFDLSPNHPNQPWLMQIALLLADEGGKTLATYSSLVRNGKAYTVDPGAQSVHGISFEECERYGIHHEFVESILSNFCHRAKTVVAHNLNFDENIIKAFCAKHRKEQFFEGMNRYCTMEASTSILKLPGQYGKYKWPKLLEAYEFFFGKQFDGAHDALADALACKDVYFAMKERGMI